MALTEQLLALSAASSFHLALPWFSALMWEVKTGVRLTYSGVLLGYSEVHTFP